MSTTYNAHPNVIAKVEFVDVIEPPDDQAAITREELAAMILDLRRQIIRLEKYLGATLQTLKK